MNGHRLPFAAGTEPGLQAVWRFSARRTVVAARVAVGLEHKKNITRFNSEHKRRWLRRDSQNLVVADVRSLHLASLRQLRHDLGKARAALCELRNDLWAQIEPLPPIDDHRLP